MIAGCWVPACAGMTGEGVGMAEEGEGVNWMEGYSGCGSAFGWGVLYLWERVLGAREI